MKDKRRDLRSYRAASARLKKKARRLGLPCSLCGKPIDYDGLLSTVRELAGAPE